MEINPYQYKPQPACHWSWNEQANRACQRVEKAKALLQGLSREEKEARLARALGMTLEELRALKK